MSKEKLEEYENKIVMQEKSKLQKESENYLNQNCERWESDSLSVDDIAIENYLAGAEPREKRIEELEKENAELKEKINILENCDRLGDMITEAYKDQLAKAKELLNEFMRISKASDEDFEHDYSELIGETEQFIKGLEE